MTSTGTPPGSSEMISSRPYLIRALYEWIVDSGLTPHVLVNAEAEQVVVPTQFVDGGRIVLNLSPTAIRELQLDNDWISFGARFGGTPMRVSFPPSAVLGIYARENGRGMLFPEEDDGGPGPEGSGGDSEAPARSRPSLKVVK